MARTTARNLDSQMRKLERHEHAARSDAKPSLSSGISSGLRRRARDRTLASLISYFGTNMPEWVEPAVAEAVVPQDEATRATQHRIDRWVKRELSRRPRSITRTSTGIEQRALAEVALAGEYLRHGLRTFATNAMQIGEPGMTELLDQIGHVGLSETDPRWGMVRVKQRYGGPRTAPGLLGESYERVARLDRATVATKLTINSVDKHLTWLEGPAGRAL